MGGELVVTFDEGSELRVSGEPNDSLSDVWYLAPGDQRRVGQPSGMSLETKASRANARQPLDDSVELRVAAEAGIECGSRERGSVA